MNRVVTSAGDEPAEERTRFGYGEVPSAFPIVHKRKINDTMSGLKKLDILEADDDDVLVVGVDEEDELIGSDSEDIGGTMKKVRCENENLRVSVTAKVDGNLRRLTPSEDKEGSDDDETCQMKWLRTVGVDRAGQLKCTVSNVVAADNMSDSGQTESVMADTIRELLNTYSKKRKDVVDKDGLVATPLHVVKKLAVQHGETLHCDVMSIKDTYHRVELLTGTLLGIGEGATKKIAAQMAAIDVLEKVQLSGSIVKVPPVAFLPGLLTDNQVFSDLMILCKAKELPRLKFVVKPTEVEDESPELLHKFPPWHAECWVGKDLVTVGQSENPLLAKREAAKEMFNLVSGAEYKDVRYAIGRNCISVAELKDAGFRRVMSNEGQQWLVRDPLPGKSLRSVEDGPLIKVAVKTLGEKTDDDQGSVASTTVSRCVSVEHLDDPDSWY